MKKFAYLLAFATLLVASCAKEAPDVPELPKVYSYASVLSDNENVPCGGVISTQFSDSPYGYDIGKLLDDDQTTAFVTEHNEFYVLWSGKKAFALKSYALVSASGEGEMPDSWVLSGSNDKSSWIKLDTKKGETFSGENVKKQYRVRNASSFKYYRFTFTTTAPKSAIAEIYLIDGTATNINDLLPLSRDNTKSTITPMGVFCENRHKTTAEDLEWLANPENEPTVAYEAEHLHYQECDVTLYPFGIPVPADVNQHAIGDCCADAVLAEMAYLFPLFIKDIITDNGDHTYTVKMFDPQGERVSVTLSNKFLCNDDLVCNGVTSKHDVVCWSTIMEKAIMKWNSIYRCSPLIDGIPIEYTAPLFTGNGESYAFDPGVLDYAQMERAVTVLLNQGWIVCGGFNKEDQIIGDGPFMTVTYHAFSFIFDASSDAVYAARNPWGWAHGDPSVQNDGVVAMVDDGRTQPTIDLRVCHPGAALEFKQAYLLPYTPPRWEN